MDADAGLGLGLSSIEQYATFEDYLDGQVSETDMFYLEDEVSHGAALAMSRLRHQPALTP